MSRGVRGRRAARDFERGDGRPPLRALREGRRGVPRIQGVYARRACIPNDAKLFEEYATALLKGAAVRGASSLWAKSDWIFIRQFAARVQRAVCAAARMARSRLPVISFALGGLGDRRGGAARGWSGGAWAEWMLVSAVAGMAGASSKWALLLFRRNVTSRSRHYAEGPEPFRSNVCSSRADCLPFARPLRRAATNPRTRRDALFLADCAHLARREASYVGKLLVSSASSRPECSRPRSLSHLSRTRGQSTLPRAGICYKDGDG